MILSCFKSSNSLLPSSPLSLAQHVSMGLKSPLLINSLFILFCFYLFIYFYLFYSNRHCWEGIWLLWAHSCGTCDLSWESLHCQTTSSIVCVQDLSVMTAPHKTPKPVQHKQKNTITKTFFFFFSSGLRASILRRSGRQTQTPIRSLRPRPFKTSNDPHPLK